MGFDLYGTKMRNAPVNYDNPEKGQYFRANVWSWRPLWDLTCQIGSDILSQRDVEAGSFNDGHLISEAKSIELADRFSVMISLGHHCDLVEKHNATMDALPLELCEHCSGTGQRDDEYVQGECNGCNGNGKKETVASFYRMYPDHIEEYETFLRHSGGFEIH